MGLEISNHYTIDAPVERVWTILAEDFVDVANWASGLDRSDANPRAVTPPDGAPAGGRVCVVPGLGTTDERIVVFDPVGHRLTYTAEAEKIPSFVTNLRNAWTLTARGAGRTEVHQRLTADVTGVLGRVMQPMMRLQFSRLLSTIEGDLRAYAETGRVSERKARERAAAR